MIVLCRNCGMRVLAQPDGSCPSCGARGEVMARVWQGKTVQTLVPGEREAAAVVPAYACLYLRPFASRFRAAARMRAVARAMRPLGTTVALHGREARAPFGKRRLSPLIMIMGAVWWMSVVLWNVLMQLMEQVPAWNLKWHGVELVDTKDDGWRPTFRRLAFRSRFIVMDVSRSGAGLSYEADFIADLELASRLIVLHQGSASARAAAEAHVQRLRGLGLDVPIVGYRNWHLRQLTSDLQTAVQTR